VIVDSTGKVIGTAIPGSIKLDDGSEVIAGVAPLEGQSVYEIDVDNDLMKRPVTEIHDEVNKLVKSKKST
jgi:hypothetical protein